MPDQEQTPRGGKVHPLEKLEWRSGQDPDRPPFLEANLEPWFYDENVTVRRYPDRYVFAYHGYSGVDDWTNDGDGDGQIMHGILVILLRIPRADYEADPDKYYRQVSSKVDIAQSEFGWPE